MTSAILVPGEVDIKGDFGKGKHKINDSNIGSKKNFGPKIILGPNNFISQKFGSNKILVKKFFDPQNIGSKKFIQNWVRY